MATEGSNARERELQQRLNELEALRKDEHDTAFAGDQREETDDISQVRQHPADIADFTYQRELQLTTQKILEQQEEQTREALERQREGQYGICASCGRPIDPARLEAVPEATLCIDCARQQEAARSA